MEEVSSQFLPLLQTLLPGFVTTIIFYWLADAPKPGQFERVVQALICSGLIKLIVSGLMTLFLWLGQWWYIAEWSATIEAIWSTGLAVAIGLLLAWWAFNDTLYRQARNLKLTSRSSTLIQEWDFAFLKYKDRYVVLNLLDGRRLMGYPRTWPSDPIKGHFVIVDPFWLEGGEMRPYDGVTSVLIANSDVLWVEFLGPPEEVA
jgi:hypothetical protein